MHDDALRAAREALHAVKVNGARQRFTDEAADAMVRAAVSAFLRHVKVSREMREAALSRDDREEPNVYDGVWASMAAQLRKEIA